jgi:MFS family permease
MEFNDHENGSVPGGKAEFLLESSADRNFVNGRSTLTKKLKVRDSYGPKEGRRIFKNLIALSCCFILLFTSFFSMSNLQTSLITEEGLGQYALATIYLALTISSLFLPSLLIRKLTAKWTLILCMAGYMVYIAAQFYPTFGILIPAAVFIGLAAAPLWAAQAIYIKQLGEEYAYFTSKSKEVILQRFYGLFSLLFVSAQIWGSLIAIILFSSEEEINIDEVDLGHCGANHCPAGHPSTISRIIAAENSSSFISDSNFGFENDTDMASGPLAIIKTPNMTLIYWLSGIYLACSIAAALCAWIFLDSLERYGEKERFDQMTSGTSAKDLILGTIKHWRDPYQIFLIPITIYSGFQGGFLGADFNLGYIACAWGVKYIGYAMICFGITNGFASIVFGRVTKYTGRPAVFVLAGIVSFASIIVLFTWGPTPKQPAVFLVIAGLWGFAEGIWNPQLAALYGTIFPNTAEAAFSNVRLWNSVGFIIAYVNGTTFCMMAKLYICLVLLLFSLGCLLFLEFRLKRDGLLTKVPLNESSGNPRRNEDFFDLPD